MSFKLTKYQNYVRGLLSPLLQTSKKKFNLLTKRFKYHVSIVYLIYFKNILNYLQHTLNQYFYNLLLKFSFP